MKKFILNCSTFAFAFIITSGVASNVYAEEIRNKENKSEYCSETELSRRRCTREFGTYRGTFFVENNVVYIFEYETTNWFGQRVYVYSYAC